MANRRQISLVSGVKQELPDSDAMLVVGNPAATSAGQVATGQRTLAGREFLAARGSSWGEEAQQGLLGRKSYTEWRADPYFASSGFTVIGCGPLTTNVTVTQRTPATTNLATRIPRMGYPSASTAGSLAHARSAFSSVMSWTLGAGNPRTGFFFTARFVVSDPATVSGARMFIGMASATAAPTNVEPDTLTNHIGIAQVSGSSNLHIVFGGSSAQTKIDLGSNFPANTLSADVYELVLNADPSNNGNVGYRVERLNTGDVASGTLTNTTPGTTLPANTTFLAPRLWRCNNATALAVAFDLILMSIETQI